MSTEPKQDQRTYLGDSVYVSVESGMLKLTTWNGYGDGNTIYLESSAYEALLAFVAKLPKG